MSDDQLNWTDDVGREILATVDAAIARARGVGR